MRSKTITVQLGELCGGTWEAVRDGFGWRYTSNTGHTVRVYAEPVFGWDGYSDVNFNRVYEDEAGRRLGCNGVIYWSGKKFAEGGE
jgi:hypothetical protein